MAHLSSERSKLNETLLPMLRETCNKKINHRLVQLRASFKALLIMLAFEASVQFPHIRTYSITRWTSLISQPR